MRQKIMLVIGQEGCYFLSLVYLAEKITGRRIDAVAWYEEATKMGWMLANCYLLHPDILLGKMTGKRYNVKHASAGYLPKEGELLIARYERQKINNLMAHFVVQNTENPLAYEYDPMGESETVRHGQIVSYRVFKEIV